MDLSEVFDTVQDFKQSDTLSYDRFLFGWRKFYRKREYISLALCSTNVYLLVYAEDIGNPSVMAIERKSITADNYTLDVVKESYQQK